MPDIAIINAALVTPVGLRTDQTCASVRAGISSAAAFKWNNGNSNALYSSTIPDSCLPAPINLPEKNFTPLERRILQFTGCLCPQIVNPETAPIPLIVGLPHQTAFTRFNEAEVITWMAAQLQIAHLPGLSKWISAGRAAGLTAIQAACELLTAGRADCVLAGGVDSYHDPDLLGTLNIQARVKSSTAPDSFMPGEGAGFLLLMRAADALQKRQSILGKITSWATGFEPGHLGSETPFIGTGLTDTFQQLLDPAPSAGSSDSRLIATVYTSMNGESHWGKEWGAAYARFSRRFHPTATLQHPAEFLGDIGAATGPVMTLLAATGIRRGYRPGPALVYTSSDRGQRCAVIVDP